jgi:hypothetical protein
MYPYSFYAGAPGQVIQDQAQFRTEWQRDFFGNYFVSYRPVHVLTISRGPWMAPYQVETA